MSERLGPECTNDHCTRGINCAEGDCVSALHARIAELEAENGRLRDIISPGDAAAYEETAAARERRIAELEAAIEAFRAEYENPVPDYTLRARLREALFDAARGESDE